MRNRFQRILIFTASIFLLSACGNNTSSSSSSNHYIDDDETNNPIQKSKLSYTYTDYTEHSVYAIDNCPLQGSPKLLVFPVWFSDSSSFIAENKKETVRQDIQKAYFGTNEETGWRSVKTYYEELSGGKLSLTGTVTNWFSVSSSYKNYQKEQSGAEATNKLVASLTDQYFANHKEESRSDYDYDNDGYLDGVMLIYAAPDYTNFSDYESKDYYNLWAYCYWLQKENTDKSNPIPNVFFWASYDFMYSSSKAKTQTGKEYANGETAYCNIDTHTYIHEMGHVLGLEDYYDYLGNQYTPAGGFSMQDYNVGSHDPYSVMALGWANPYIPTESMTITLRPFQASRDLILLSPNFNNSNSPFDEYLLLEYYTPTGLNEFDSTYKYGDYPLGPNASGIRLWHVDARLVYYASESSTPTSRNITTDLTKGIGITHAMSNSYEYNSSYYDDSDQSDYLSPLGKGYYDYNLLQLIRNNSKETYRPSSTLSSSDLFIQGDSFSMKSYSLQFVNSTKLNNGYTLGWSFNVKSISSNEATIELIKS